MDANGIYGYPNWNYWGCFGAQAYQYYPCQACNVYGHDAAYCPYKGWRWQNGRWESCAPPSQGSHEANPEPRHHESVESTWERENEKRMEELRNKIEMLKARISEQEANEARGYDCDCHITKAEPWVDPTPCHFAPPENESSQTFVSPIAPKTNPSPTSSRPIVSCLISSASGTILQVEPSKDTMVVPNARYREYVPQIFRVYEEHDRGPTSLCNPTFLEHHRGEDSILRLTKRHIDAILDKRIIVENWGVSLSKSLPSSLYF